ncbi:MAG: aldose epimerase family protein [Paludibacter sp.]
MQVTKRNWGLDKNGKEVFLYTISNANNQTIKITNYGGIITSWLVPGDDGKMIDIVLGKDNFEDYLDNPAYMGCLVGRVVNRIKNGRFAVNGTEYQLALNDGENHNHGGLNGFNKVVWDSESFENEDNCGVILTYLSPDGEENYPGNLLVKVTYSFTNNNALIIHYQAETDKSTVINLTNHTYFNLKGEDKDNALDSLLKINSNEYTETDNQYIPTGRILSVKNTFFDFTEFQKIGQYISEIAYGYNVNYVLKNPKDLAIPSAIAIDLESGRTLEVFTTEPGLQLYTAGYMQNEKGKKGKFYGKFAGFCLETQHFPDATNHAHFPSIVLNPSEKYESRTVYSISLMNQNNTHT